MAMDITAALDTAVIMGPGDMRKRRSMGGVVEGIKANGSIGG
jgi:hypothetical protein